jgi:hypothetical protein
VTEIKFEDQFSEGIVVSSETKHVIFVADKEMSKVMTEYLSEAKPNLKEMKTVYVSDISKNAFFDHENFRSSQDA